MPRGIPNTPKIQPMNITQMQADNFSGSPREHLAGAYVLKTSMAPPQDMSDEELREELRTLYKTRERAERAAAAVTEIVPVAGPPLPANIHSKLGKIPYLGSAAAWEGRKRRVTVHKTDQQSVLDSLPLGWDGVMKYVPFETQTDIPWPYWSALRQTTLLDDMSDDVTEWVKTRNKQLVKKLMDEYASTGGKVIKTIQFTDHGDTPGTETLPISYTDFFQRRAAETHCFSGFKRPALIVIHNKLTEEKPPTYFAQKQMTDDDIRMEIAERLGTSFLSLVLDDLYAESDVA